MKEWKKVKLGEISLNITDGKHGDCQNQEKSGYYFISCKDIIDGAIQYENARQITEEDYIETNKRTQLECNDVLITNSGTIGRMALVKDIPETKRTTFQKSVAIIKPNQKYVLPIYLYYLLQSKVSDFINNSNGSAQKNLLLSTLRSFELNIESDLGTQHRIASILSRYDALIENYQKQIKLLEEAAARLYKQWFVELKFPGYQNTTIIDGVPEGWEKKKLAEIADITMGQSPKSDFYNNDKIGLPFHQGVGSYGTRFIDDCVYSSSFNKIAEPNSVLFSVRAPVGRLNLTKNKIAIGRGLAAINHKKGFQSFLFYLLKERFFKDNIIGNGSIFASISKTELFDLDFIIPSENLESKFNKIANNFDRSIMSLDSQIRHLTESRDRLLPKLMSGELEV